MFRTMRKSKSHCATVTHADLLEDEQVTIIDIDNGNRPVTYAITGQRGSGVTGINGAAAHLVHPGDLVILIAYGTMDDASDLLSPRAVR